MPEHLLTPVGEHGRLSRPYDGRSGLGIELVRRLVELHGGELTVANRDSGGAAFRVHLPSVTSPDPDLAAASAAE